MYKIKPYSYRQAKKFGVQIYPSVVQGKKIDVYKKGRKIASIGATGYYDYPTYLERYGLQYAKERQRLYKKRHQQNRIVKNSPGYWADKILW
jgi:hypothetical protein